jgi:hypothetical protein
MYDNQIQDKSHDFVKKISEWKTAGSGENPPNGHASLFTQMLAGTYSLKHKVDNG